MVCCCVAMKLGLFFFAISFFLVLNQASITTEENVQRIKRELLAKADVMSTWTATNMHSYHPDVKQFKLRKYRGITEAEVAMMQRIVHRLRNVTIASTHTLHSFTHGLLCSSTQRHTQTQAMKHVEIGICTDESAYKVAHLGFPEASTFVDIGCNKGYTTALIAGLWSGFNTGLTPYLLFKKYEELGVFQGAHSPAGYCRTGLDRAYPLRCPEGKNNRHQDGQCDRQAGEVKPLTIYAIDGSSSVLNHLRSSLQIMTPLNGTDLVRNIHTFHLAMSHREGHVQFSTVDEEAATGFEGGSIIRDSSRQKKADRTSKLSESVSMTTLNAFALSQDIQNRIDFIKIDAEGHDLEVIKGANETLLSVGILMWEQVARRSVMLAATIKTLERLMFECYVPAVTGFVKLTKGCSSLKSLPLGANIVCASRHNAPSAVLAFDLLSLFYDDGLQ